MNAEAGLTRMVHEVRELELGERTSYAAGRLTVGEESVLDLFAIPRSPRSGWASPRPATRCGSSACWTPSSPARRGPAGAACSPGCSGLRCPRGAAAPMCCAGPPCWPPAFCPARRRRSSTCRGRRRRFRRSPRRTTSSSSGRPPRMRTGGTSTRRCGAGLVKVAAHLAEAALDAEPDAVEEVHEPGGRTATASRVSGSSSTSRPRASSRTSSSTGAACPAGWRPSSRPASSTTGSSSAGSTGIPR